jgi:hypothetical protein
MVLNRILAAMALAAAAASGPAVRGQTVYFQDDLFSPDIVLMRGVSPDGRQLQTLPHGVAGEPSHSQFTESTPSGPFSYRWFLTADVVGDGLFYPNGNPHVEICAIRPTADGGVIRVPLTALWTPDAGAPTVRLSASTNNDVARWSNGQQPGFFSFSGFLFDASDAFVDQVYYRVHLDVAAFDAAVREGTWSPATLDQLETVMTRSEALNPLGSDWVIFNGHHWSPDGTKLARVQDGRYLIVRDVAARSERIIYSAVNLQGNVAWAPTGPRIAFGEYYNGGRIVAINPDGTSPRVLIQGSQKGFRSLNYTSPVWSPDAQSLACVRENWDHGRMTVSTDVVRIPAGGTTKPVSITSAIITDGSQKGTVGWRP